MRMKYRLKYILFILFCTALAAGCSHGGKKAGRLKITVSIAPEKYFVERLAGRRADVTVLVAPGADPHTYQASPRQLAALSESRVYFTIGVPFESALVERIKKQNPDLSIIDISRGIKRMEMVEDEHKGAHEHGDMDPHAWLSPRMAAVMVRNMCAALVRIDPAHKSDYENNRDNFVFELKTLDKDIAGVLAPYRGRAFYVYHPAFGYFGRAYGLRQAAVETGGKEPATEHITRLIRQARRDNVRVIFVQPQFSQKSADLLAKEIGGVVVPVDPLGENYVDNIKRIAAAIRNGMEASKK